PTGAHAPTPASQLPRPRSDVRLVVSACRLNRVLDLLTRNWALGSAVEHRLHTAGVSGSNPLAPTNAPSATEHRGAQRAGISHLLRPQVRHDSFHEEMAEPDRRSNLQDCAFLCVGIPPSTRVFVVSEGGRTLTIRAHRVVVSVERPRNRRLSA